MLSNEEISERNGLLISLIKELDLGIRVVDLPHKPKFLSHDYSTSFHAYVKNFHLILCKGTASDEVYLDIRLKPIENMGVEEIKPKILEWMVMFQHEEIHTIKLKGTGLYLVGFNHHNKALKKNPYPVFAYYDPIYYYSLERAEDTLQRFSKYDLVINQPKTKKNDFESVS
jgi:hypothetical protein